MPKWINLKWIATNYKTDKFVTHNFKGMGCYIETEGDPLTKFSKKTGKQIMPDDDPGEGNAWVMSEPGVWTALPKDEQLSFKMWRRAKELYLNGNSIGPAGAEALAGALRVNGALKTLVVDSAIEEHAGLVAACKAKGVELV